MINIFFFIIVTENFVLRSPAPVDQWLKSPSATRQGVGSNLAQIAKEFSTDREWLLSALSKGMGVCDVGEVSALSIDLSLWALSSFGKGDGWRSGVNYVIFKTMVNNTHTHTHTHTHQPHNSTSQPECVPNNSWDASPWSTNLVRWCNVQFSDQWIYLAVASPAPSSSSLRLRPAPNLYIPSPRSVIASILILYSLLVFVLLYPFRLLFI